MKNKKKMRNIRDLENVEFAGKKIYLKEILKLKIRKDKRENGIEYNFVCHAEDSTSSIAVRIFTDEENEQESMVISDGLKAILEKYLGYGEDMFTKKELEILKKLGEELFIRGYKYEDKEIETLEKIDNLI